MRGEVRFKLALLFDGPAQAWHVYLGLADANVGQLPGYRFDSISTVQGLIWPTYAAANDLAFARGFAVLSSSPSSFY